MEPLTVLSRAVVAGGLSGARPALTLLLLQGFARFFAGASFPPETLWIIHEYTIVIVAAVALVEHYTRSDPDLEELMEVPNKVIGVGVSIMLSSIILQLGGEISPPEEAAPSNGEVAAVQVVMAGFPEGLLGLRGLTILLAVAASLGMSWVRKRVMLVMADASISERWWRWLETGAVIGAVAAISLVPLLAVVLAAALVVVGAAVGGAIWSVQKARDERARTDCSCGKRVRKEAVYCPSCHAEITPEVRLGQATSSPE